ncbi:MAG: matrixin family metalloprotease [Oligoflexales bacterium]|nr:matrixin family metalloprotease [Oligoflexales bacterium]
MDRIFSTLLSGLILLICLPSSRGLALSYPTPVDFSRQVLKWPLAPENPTVSYRVVSEFQYDYDRFITTIHRAADLWGNVSGSLLDLSWTQDNQDALITLHLQSSINDTSFSAGYAEFDEVGEEGEPIHCSIFILVSPSFSFNSIAKTILHEFGHCLGLGHSLIPEAIMSYLLDKNRFQLDLDDMAAIVRLYPLQGDAQIAPGCGVGTRQKRSESIQLFLMLLFPLMALVMRRIVVTLVR